MVVFVLMQKSNEGGVSSVIMGGSSDTFFGKNKARSKEAKLQKVTKALAVVFFILCLFTSLLLAFFRTGLQSS